MVKASLSLAQLFKSKAIFVPRASYDHGGWFTRDRGLLEAMGGSLLLVKGAMPMVAHRDCFRPEHLKLYEGVAEVDSESLRGYGNEEEFQSALAEIAHQKEAVVVVQHRYPESELAASACLVAPDLLGQLNQKSKLEDWVEASRLLPRKLVSVLEARSGEVPALPVVVKAAGVMTSGGGMSVRICRDLAGWRKALDDFGAAEILVVEKYTIPRQILGVQFAVPAEGGILYLGSSENELKPDGYVHGNWLAAASEASPEIQAVGRKIAQRAASAGYRGVVGIDFLVGIDGQAWVIDLNFRCCAGTPGLLLAESMKQEWQCQVMFSSMLNSKLPVEKLFPLLKKGIARREILPLGGYFSNSVPHRILLLLVVGKDRGEVKARRRKWERRLKTRSRRSLRFWRAWGWKF